MKYEKITKIARILKNIFLVLSILMLLGLPGFGLIIVNMTFWNGLTPEMVKELSEMLQVEVTATDIKLLMVSLFLLVFMTFFLFMSIRKLLKLIEKNASPFQKEITEQLRKVIFWEIVSLLPNLGILILILNLNLSDFFSLTYNVIFIALLYLLLLIFEYGISLQTEVDETL